MEELTQKRLMLVIGDLLDGKGPSDIQYDTGIPIERCEEIWSIGLQCMEELDDDC